jgi:membrane protease YdiL (CAAX protease family)
MNQSASIINRYSLVLFFGLTILLSFALTPVLSYAVKMQILPPDIESLLVVFVPSVLAILLAGMIGARKAVAGLLKKLVQWRVGFKWYAVALVVALAVRLSVSLLALVLGGIPRIQIRAWAPVQFIALFMLLYIAAALEELGWRGFALPKLLTQRSALFSSLSIGVLWGTVHLALHLPGLMLSAFPWPATLIELMGLSVIITWLFVNTGGSLVIASLYHTAQSFFVILNDGISRSQQSWLLAICNLVLVLILVLVSGPALRRGPSKHPAAMDIDRPAAPEPEV